jgi:acyl-CoA thioesterase I
MLPADRLGAHCGVRAGGGTQTGGRAPERGPGRCAAGTPTVAYEVVNAGVSGDTAAGGLNRLDWSLEGDVAILVIELGANDGLRGLPVSQLRRNLSEIITRAQQRGVTVILTGMEAPPNYGVAYTSEFRRVFRDLADQYEVMFVPFFLEGVAGIPSLNNSDGMHPNAAGARVIAENIWRVLEPTIEKQDR